MAPVTDELDDVITRVLAGDGEAWTRLVSRVYPIVVAFARSRRFVASGDPEDTQREIATRALERLRAGDFAALRSFRDARDRHPDTSFERWLRVVARNTYVDYLRGLPEYQRPRATARRALERVEVVALSSATMPAARSVEVASVIAVRRLMRVIAAADFPPDQRRALTSWLWGHSAAEIARELDLADAAAAHRLLNAARERLRRYVRTPRRKGGDR